MKILIIQQKMIGDVLTSSILFEVLRKQYPKAELHYLIQKHTEPVVRENPFIDLIIFDQTDKNGNQIKFLRFLNRIKTEKYDVVIDVYSKIGSSLITAASGADKKIGYKKWYTSSLYTHTLEYNLSPETKAGLAIENRLKLLEPLKFDFNEAIRPKIYLTQSELVSAKKFLKEAKVNPQNKLIMIGMLGSSENKTYPLPYLAKVLDTIVLETRANLLLNYIPTQKEQVEELLSHCKSQTLKFIHQNVYGKSLREFMALTANCDALIGNEGGAINMAKALSIPTFAIFSPWISLEAWASYQNDLNASVHLKNYKPELYIKKYPKELKPESHTLYKEFKPEFFNSRLREFLNKLA